MSNNPVMRIDPTGMLDWQPNGDGSYTAEAGDGAETLARDAGIPREDAYRVMEEQGHGTYVDPDDGITKSAVDIGDKVVIPEQKEAFEKNQAEIKKEISDNNQMIKTNDKKSDSLYELAKELQKHLEISEKINESRPDFPDEPRGGLGLGVGVRNTAKELKIKDLMNEVHELNKASDSLDNLNKEKIKQVK